MDDQTKNMDDQVNIAVVVDNNMNCKIVYEDFKKSIIWSKNHVFDIVFAIICFRIVYICYFNYN